MSGVIFNIRYWFRVNILTPFCSTIGHKWITHVCEQKYLIKEKCGRCRTIFYSVDEQELEKYKDEQERYYE